MITLYKPNKEFYKLENNEIIGGKIISAKTEQQLKDFKEFNNIDEAYEFFGIEKPNTENILQEINLQRKLNRL